jgi:NADPH-dependent 2,4-dienoyl-CoA reductase/sulfur reductase-like enzyme
VRVLQETITAIDPVARRVTTDAGVHEADVLVVALGADYDVDATPASPKQETSSTRSPVASGMTEEGYIPVSRKHCRRDSGCVRHR